MSIEQYQRTVNTLDKEIADLEKKKATFEKKATDAKKKASNVSISKNASSATIKSKMRQVERYQNDAVKADEEKAALGKKIAEKRKKRNVAYIRLQKEEEKQHAKQNKMTKQMQQFYEKKLENLQSQDDIDLSMDDIYSERMFDVFVSHAWEDKEEFVDSLVEALENVGLKVWYDTKQIRWGDSMRARIDEGLRKSRFGIVVLSPSYIAENKYWTKTELDGLFQLESINGKTILPIWHNLTKQQVIDYSSIVASKLALTTSQMTVSEIANEVLMLMSQEMEEL